MEWDTNRTKEKGIIIDLFLSMGIIIKIFEIKN